jgi:putative ABC transport system substrate-binding protein
MKRRRFLGLAGGAAIAAPAIAAPAQAQQLPAIGYLTLRTPDGDSPLQAAFVRGLAEAGFEENRNIAIAFASAYGRVERLKALAAELVNRRVAVIFAASSNAALAAKAATTTIPIVYTGASDPVRLGLAQSLGRPGGNLTGLTMYSHTYSAKRLELLHELVPQAATLGLLVNPTNPSAEQETQDLRQAATALGLQTVLVEARAESDLDGAFARLADAKVGALYLFDDPMLASPDSKVVPRALRASMAVISTLREMAERGALASYGTDFPQLYRDAALYVARILRGESPADLPIMLPTRFSLTLNLKTARALGLAIPPSVLGRADEVIE